VSRELIMTKDYKQPARDYNGNIIVRVGDNFRWETIGGEKFEGKIVEMDSNVATVRCTDGVKRTVEL